MIFRKLTTFIVLSLRKTLFLFPMFQLLQGIFGIADYDKYIEKLTQKERSKLEWNINKRLHVFKQSYPSNICISKDSLLKDKLVFCLKEVKKNRMKAIPRTNNL